MGCDVFVPLGYLGAVSGKECGTAGIRMAEAVGPISGVAYGVQPNAGRHSGMIEMATFAPASFKGDDS